MKEIKYSVNKFEGATSVVQVNVGSLYLTVYTNDYKGYGAMDYFHNLQPKEHIYIEDVIDIEDYEAEQKELDEFIKEHLL